MIKQQGAPTRNHDNQIPIGVHRRPRIRDARDGEAEGEEVELDGQGAEDEDERHEEEAQEAGFRRVRCLEQAGELAAVAVEAVDYEAWWNVSIGGSGRGAGRLDEYRNSRRRSERKLAAR